MITYARRIYRTRWALWGLTLLAFALRVYRLDFQSLWRDEVDAVIFAQRDVLTLLGKFLQVGENGPLYFLSLHYWMGLAGGSEFAIRFFSLCFGVLAVPLAYRLGRGLMLRPASLLAALLLTLSPYHIWYSQEAKMYALLTFATLLSLYLFLRGLTENRWYVWSGYVAATGLSLYVHFFALLIVPVQGLWLALLGGRHPAGRRSAWVAWGVLALPYLPLAAWQLPLLLKPTATGYHSYSLRQMITILFRVFSLGFHPAMNALAAGPFIFLLLAGLSDTSTTLSTVIASRRRSNLPPPQGIASGAAHPRNDTDKIPSLPCLALLRRNLALAFYLLVPVLIVWLVSLRRPMFTDRYLIFVLPAYYFLLALGLSRTQRLWPPLFALSLLLVCFFFGRGLWVQDTVTLKADFRGAVQAFERQARPDDLVIFLIPYVQRAFHYYHPQEVHSVEPPFTNYGMSAEELSREMQRAVSGYRRVWLFLSEAHVWDARGLVVQWFEAHGRLVSAETFAYVELRGYDIE